MTESKGSAPPPLPPAHRLPRIPALERIARPHVPLAEPRAEPAHALRRGAVGEGVRHHAALGVLLQAVVADRASRRCSASSTSPGSRRCFALRRGAPRRRRSSRPAARAAPRARSPPPRLAALCCARCTWPRCRAGSARGGRPRARSRRPARSRRARRTAARAREEGEVEVDLAVGRAVERPDRRRARAAGRVDGAGEQHEPRLAVAAAARAEELAPARPRCRPAPPTRTPPARRPRPPARPAAPAAAARGMSALGPADQDARVDRRRPADRPGPRGGRADAEPPPAPRIPMPRRSSTFSLCTKVVPPHGLILLTDADAAQRGGGAGVPLGVRPFCRACAAYGRRRCPFLVIEPARIAYQPNR